MRDTSTAARENPAPWKANGATGMPPPVSCHLAPPSRTSRPPKKVAFTQPDASPVRGTIAPESPLRTAGRHSSKSLNHSLEGWHPSAFHLPTGFYATNRHHMPMSLSPDTYLAAATCPCQLRSMPISPPPDAYVNFATCPCHSGDMPMSLWRDAYVTTCDMPMSPK